MKAKVYADCQYSQFGGRVFCDEKHVNIGKFLLDSLPHGSGINYDWHIHQRVNMPDVWETENCFESMNESGMYCHALPFKAVYRLVDGCKYCRDGLRGEGPCLMCDGESGFKFSLVSLTFYGKREYMCCQYQLKDYLWEILTWID